MKTVATYMGMTIYYDCAQVPGDLCGSLKMPPPHSACAIFLHSVDWNEIDFANLIKRLIEGGCVYFILHGHRCEEAHHLTDKVIRQCLQETQDSVIMTTSHEDESIEEALSFCLLSAWPAADYDSTFSSRVILSFGSTGENADIQRLLANPEIVAENPKD